MRDPHRWRNIALGFFASGWLASAAAFLLPGLAEGSWMRTCLFIYGISAIILGGGTALFRHFDARAKEALARGDDIIARWRVEPAAWDGFVARDRKWSPESGFPPNESIHRLPRRGTPEISDAILHDDGPGVIELRLYYPGGGRRIRGTASTAAVSLAVPRRERVLGGGGRRGVAHFRGDLGGEPDFFHGKGDGTDPEDLSKCYHCEFETHRFVSHCRGADAACSRSAGRDALALGWSFADS